MSTTETYTKIQEILTQQFAEKVFNFTETYGMLSFEAPKENNLEVLSFLSSHPELGFKFMTDLCAVHFPDKKGAELQVVYHMHNLESNVRIRFKVSTSVEEPTVASAAILYPTANWMERETYDFFGVVFTGHPNLKRILNVDEMTYFPLRKEFPLEDQTRVDKDDEMFGRGGNLLTQSLQN